MPEQPFEGQFSFVALFIQNAPQKEKNKSCWIHRQEMQGRDNT